MDLLQGKDGQGYEFAPKEAVRLPAGQLSILTLPRFLAIPLKWPEAGRANGGSPAEPAATNSEWHTLQLGKIEGGKLICGTALTPS